MTGTFQRYTRDQPCPVCGHHGTDPAGHCHGGLTDNGAFARCTRADGADGAMLDEKCSPPAYVYRRHEDGAYRPWTERPPMPPPPITKPYTEAHSAPQQATEKPDGKTHPRLAGKRLHPYSETEGVEAVRRVAGGKKECYPRVRDDADAPWRDGKGIAPKERIYHRADLDAMPDVRVYVVEGEGCADILHDAGEAAITWRGGCGQLKQSVAQIVEAVRGRDVALLSDADSTGRATMMHIALALRGVARTVRIVNLYEDESGRDIEDWLHEGGTVDRLTARIDATPAYETDASTRDEWTPKITYLSDVQPERVRHLWPGRLPLGKLAVVDGDPGLGKTTVLLDIGARLTTHAPMPDGTRSDLNGPAGVVILTAEDGLADTIRPRLDAAGADVSRVVALECLVNGDEERSLSLTDLDAIEAAVRAVDAKLVIIDPLVAFLGSETNSYRDQDMRRVLAPLARLAERLGCAIVVIRHLSKGGGDKAVYRGGGSIGIIGAARCGLLVAADPEDETGARRILAVTKSNLAAMPPALAYTLQPAANGTAYVAWEGATAHTAKQLLALPEDDGERGAKTDAMDVLRTILADGPMSAADVKREAAQAGVAERTLRRAKDALGVIVRKDGYQGQWLWELPEAPSTEGHESPKVAKDDQRCPHQNDGHLWQNMDAFDSHEREAAIPSPLLAETDVTKDDESHDESAAPLSAADVRYLFDETEVAR